MEKNIYNSFGFYPFYCIDDEEEKPILEGNFDSLIEMNKFKTFRFVVNYCNEKTRLKRDPECSPDEKIDEWLKGKNALIKVINKQIKLKDFNVDFF